MRPCPLVTTALLFFCISSANSQTTHRQDSKPPVSQSKKLPGAITLTVDASDVPRRILHAREEIPVSPGPLTLVYPKWIPGEHMPSGPIDNLAGLNFTAGGKNVSWRRDDVDMFAFHVDLPAGASTLEIALDYLEPTQESGFSGATSVTDKLAVINWNQVLLYPQGMTATEVMFAPRLRLPVGWKFGSPLDVARQGGFIEFASVPLNTLVDSPVITGQYFRVVPLAPSEKIRHQIDIAADSEAALAIVPRLEKGYTNLVLETGALFGSRHYRHYEFLLSLSDHVAHFGLEHHESSDDRAGERYLVDEPEVTLGTGLFPHEFTHSWNGKYRRPAGLATPDYQQPMKGELLWVYEGLTQYLGHILTARSDLITPDQYRESLAVTAAFMQIRPGRKWRSLEDTAVSAPFLYDSPTAWDALRRSVDFYPEGDLLWLDADVTIRQLTRGQKSLNDFCKLFYGGASGEPEMKPYTFDDLVAAMNQVVAYDWRKFFQGRVDVIQPDAPLGGIENGGWKLVFNDTVNEFMKDEDDVYKTVELRYSIGVSLTEEGKVRDVIPAYPAAQAGIAPGMKIIAVNGRKFSRGVIHDAIKASKDGKQPIELLAENTEFYRTYNLNYHEGEKYPHLVKDESKPDLLSEIVKPLATHPQ
ncbi:MAG TPA: M61 family peptidase [Terriglobales bacterium]|nr:M61 family peptidase [Terriglobales bacterium]